MQFHVAIVEDEDEAVQELCDGLTQFGKDENCAFTTTCFRDGTQFLREYRPIYDVIFLDIRMPRMDGMTAAQKLRQLDPVVPLVFVTSMVQFAVKGYEVEALDFIVKPLRYSSFRLKMKRIVQALEYRQRQGIMLTVDGASLILRTADIFYIEVSDHNLTYHCAQGDYLVRGKLGTVERQLSEQGFFRCSSSFLVNLHYVDRVLNEDIEVRGTLIRISRAKKKEFMAAMTAYLGKGG